MSRIKLLEKSNAILIDFFKWCYKGNFIPSEYVSTTQLASIITDRTRKVRKDLEKLK